MLHIIPRTHSYYKNCVIKVTDLQYLYQVHLSYVPICDERLLDSK